MEKFFTYLDKIRPLINARALEKSAGIPTNALGKHFAWRDGKEGYQLPPAHIGPIIRALCAVFGNVQIGEVRLYTFENEPVIIGVMDIGEPETIEIETGSFEYRQPQRRSLYDPFDFVHYF